MVFSVNQLLTICWPITDLTPGGYLSHTCLSFIGMCCLKGFGVWCRFAGLSLRAGGRGFSPATKRVAPGYFYWKIEEK